VKVSVIIPVYNTGEYLEKCVCSVCRQTYTELQIVIVDDGSDEVTAGLCDRLAARDARIEVIHKSNGGVSKARNAGICRASGEVLCFVDSDDTISPVMIERLVNALVENDAQVAMCDATTVAPGRPDRPDTIPLLPGSCTLEAVDIDPAMLTLLAGSVWRCAYMRTSMPGSGELMFPEELKFSEDRIYNVMAMGGARRIAYIKEPLYNRLIRRGSACFRFYPDMTSQIERIHGVLIAAVEKYWGEAYVAAYESQMAGHIRYAVTNYTSPRNGLSPAASVRALKALCGSRVIRYCLVASSEHDVRTRLILSGQCVALYIIGLLTNIIHSICRKCHIQQ